MKYAVIDGGVLALESGLESIKEADAIIFDCDGTLVDSAPSLISTGKLITAIYLDQFLGVECSIGADYDEVFQLFKMLGGFNNIRRIVSIILQAIFVELECPDIKKTMLEPIDLEDYEKCLSWRSSSSPDEVKRSLEWLISELAGRIGEYVTPSDLETLLERRASSPENLEKFRRLIGPISPYGAGMMTTLFSELYIGSEGVRRKYGKSPKFYDGPGIIEDERLMVKPETLEELKDLVRRGLAIFSGKGRWEVEKILTPILGYFNLEASIFTGDKGRELDKPIPIGLIECCKRLGADHVLYVGDGGEDLFLIMRAREKGIRAHLAAVLTNKYSYAFFTRRRADAILENANFLPKLFKRA